MTWNWCCLEINSLIVKNSLSIFKTIYKTRKKTIIKNRILSVISLLIITVKSSAKLSWTVSYVNLNLIQIFFKTTLNTLTTNVTNVDVKLDTFQFILIILFNNSAIISVYLNNFITEIIKLIETIKIKNNNNSSLLNSLNSSKKS